MSIYLGSNQIDTINLISYQSFNTNIEDALINRIITSYSNSEISNIRGFAFTNCSSLTEVNFPSCTTLGTNAFTSCSSLTSVRLPQATTIGSYAFYSCSSLTSVSLPQATTIGSYAFAYCYSLASVSLPQATTIGSNAFRNCYNLLSLYLLGSSIPSLANINAFVSTPISNYTTSTGGVYGSIYVPASLYNSYITATNWSNYSSRIVSV